MLLTLYKTSTLLLPLADFNEVLRNPCWRCYPNRSYGGGGRGNSVTYSLAAYQSTRLVLFAKHRHGLGVKQGYMLSYQKMKIKRKHEKKEKKGCNCIHFVVLVFFSRCGG